MPRKKDKGKYWPGVFAAHPDPPAGYQEKAEKILKASRPPNWAYFGDLPIGETWGYTVSKTRDSTLREISNFEVIKADLEERFPGSVEDERHSHWAVGWIDKLAVELLNKEGLITYPGVAVIEWADALENYPVASDEHYSNLEYDESIKNIEGKLDEDLREGVESSAAIAEEVYSWLSENRDEELQSRDDQGASPSDDAIRAALLELDYADPETEEEIEADIQRRKKLMDPYQGRLWEEKQ